MAFGDKSLSNKQRLNLSTVANDVIENDMFTFDKENRSNFINMIFQYFSPRAEASISRSVNMYQGKLSELLSPIPADDMTKRRIVNVLTQKYMEELNSKAHSYGKGHGFYIWLNEKNYEYLTEPESECNENKYYRRRGDYIKSVLEEYARLPYVERERIVFTPRIDDIYDAIERKCQLRLEISSHKVFSVYPYSILCDPLSTANYLVGYATPYDSPSDDKSPCSFRISALRSLRVEKSKRAALKKSDWDLLDEEIVARGVQFLSTDDIEIQVRLTSKGQENYHRQVHLRPRFIRCDGDIFTFSCTAIQAEFYFIKFGKEAEIISPANLRNTFASIYKEAVDTYSCKQTDMNTPDQPQ